jgi:dienelactone hydrolase
MPRGSLKSRIDDLAPHADFLLPSGEGPFPLVAQFHGCGGKKPFQMQWAEAARRAGFAVLVVDSFAHRRISRVQAYCMVCTGALLPGAERAGDVYAAMAWARGQPLIDSNRIAIAGWSHGGWAVLEALALTPGRQMQRATGISDLPDDPMQGLVGAFLVYPYAGIACTARRQPLRYDVAPLALVGAKDTTVGSHDLRRALASIRTPGGSIAVHWLEDCTHAFDEAEARDLRVKHNAAQTIRAQKIYVDYLAQAFSR